MKHRRKLERRTYLQDRFEILLKKQKNGDATFNELTELDEIVNRSAVIRERILAEMHNIDNQPDGLTEKEIITGLSKQPESLLSKIKSFWGRMFTVKLSRTQFLLYFEKYTYSF